MWGGDYLFCALAVAVAQPQPLPQRQVGLHSQRSPQVHAVAWALAQPQVDFAQPQTDEDLDEVVLLMMVSLSE